MSFLNVYVTILKRIMNKKRICGTNDIFVLALLYFRTPERLIHSPPTLRNSEFPKLPSRISKF